MPHYSLGHNTRSVSTEDGSFEQHFFWVEKTLPNGQRFVSLGDQTFSGWCLNSIENPHFVLDFMLTAPTNFKCHEFIAIRELALDKWLQRAHLLGGLILNSDNLDWHEVEPVYGSDVYQQRDCEYDQICRERQDAEIFG